MKKKEKKNLYNKRYFELMGIRKTQTTDQHGTWKITSRNTSVLPLLSIEFIASWKTSK